MLKKFYLIIWMIFTCFPGLSFTKELTLDLAIKKALNQSPDIQIQNSEEKAALGFKKHEGRFFISPPKLMGSYSTDDPYQNEGEYEYSLGVSLELEIAGQFFLRNKIGALEYDKAKEMSSWTRFVITQQVKEKFYTLLYLQEKQKLLQTQVSSSQNLSFISQEQLKKGNLSDFEATLNRIDYASLYATLASVKMEYSQVKEELANLIGEDLEKMGSVTGAWALPKSFPGIDTLYNHAINHRLDFKTAVLNKKQKQKSYSLAVASLVPNPEFSVSFSKGKSVIHGDEFDGDPAITSVLGENSMTDKMLHFEVSVPLTFLSGKKGEILQAKAEKEKSEWETKKMEQEIRNSITRLKNQWAIANDTLKHLGGMGNIKRNLVLLNEGYQKGNIDLVTYTVQRNRLVEAELNILESRMFLTKTQIALETAAQIEKEGL